MTNPYPDHEILSELEDIKDNVHLLKEKLEQHIGTLEYLVEKINKMQAKLSSVTG